MHIDTKNRTPFYWDPVIFLIDHLIPSNLLCLIEVLVGSLENRILVITAYICGNTCGNRDIYIRILIWNLQVLDIVSDGFHFFTDPRIRVLSKDDEQKFLATPPADLAGIICMRYQVL